MYCQAREKCSWDYSKLAVGMRVAHKKKKKLESRTVSWRIHGSYCFLFPRHYTCALAVVLESYQGGRSRVASNEACHMMSLFLEDKWLGGRAAITKS